MAMWIVHLWIADRVAERFVIPDETAFAVGTIAPDSGQPKPDGRNYEPSKTVSHFRTAGRIDPEKFAETYLSPDKIAAYTPRAFSFHLGYYVHLLTDVEWVNRIYWPVMQHYEDSPQEMKDAVRNAMRRDWIDNDYLFLETHPEPYTYRLYRSAAGFRNEYISFFEPDAFEVKQRLICSFYQSDHGPLDRDYPYLTPAATDRFVDETSETIVRTLTEKGWSDKRP